MKPIINSNLALLGLVVASLILIVIIFTYSTESTYNSLDKASTSNEIVEPGIQVVPIDSVNNNQDYRDEFNTAESPTYPPENTTVTTPTPTKPEPVVAPTPEPEPVPSSSNEFAEKAAAYDETIVSLPSMATSMIFSNLESQGLDPDNLSDQEKAYIYDQLVANGIAR